MIKDNQQKFNRLHVVLDALVLIISYAAAFGLLILGNRVYSPHKQVLPAQPVLRHYLLVPYVLLLVPGSANVPALKRPSDTHFQSPDFANLIN